MTTSRILHAGMGACLGVAAVAAGAPAQAADDPDTATIVVYYDLDNDSRRDAGEPGVPDQALNSANGVITDADGRAIVDLGPSRPNDPATVRLSTGWFRSGCADVNCEPATDNGRQNDFGVRNQFIKLTVAEPGGTYHVGIVPDWPGGYDEMPQTFGWADDGDGVLAPGEATGSVNEVDVSTRLSWRVPSGAACNRTNDESHRACRPGDSPRLQFQVMNEGTVELTGVSGVLEMPFDSPIDATATMSPFNQPGLDLQFGSYDPVTGAYPWTIEGTMGPGAVAQFVVTTTVPDEVRPSPEPSSWDHVLVNRVTAVDQWTAVNDTDSAQCTTGAAPRCDATVGKHNKQSSAEDDVDDIAFSVVEVAAGNEVPSVYDLALVLSTTTDAAAAAGDLVSFSVEVTNQGTRHVRNTQLVVHPPAGLTFSVADNPAWADDATTVLQGQLAAGAKMTVGVDLRVSEGATAAMNGSSALRNLAEISSVLDAESGAFVPDDIDSTPDLDAANDGYDVTDPWDPAGDDIITDGESTIGTSAGGEDDQDPADIMLSDDRPVCSATRWGGDVSLSFAGGRGANANLLRDGVWLAIVTGTDSFTDSFAPADATYTLRTRQAGTMIDVECGPGDVQTNPPACTAARVGSDVVLSFSGHPGSNANVLRDGVWLALVTDASSYLDVSAPDDATYALRVRESGVIIDTTCAAA